MIKITETHATQGGTGPQASLDALIAGSPQAPGGPYRAIAANKVEHWLKDNFGAPRDLTPKQAKEALRLLDGIAEGATVGSRPALWKITMNLAKVAGIPLESVGDMGALDNAKKAVKNAQKELTKALAGNDDIAISNAITLADQAAVLAAPYVVSLKRDQPFAKLLQQRATATATQLQGSGGGTIEPTQPGRDEKLLGALDAYNAHASGHTPGHLPVPVQDALDRLANCTRDETEMTALILKRLAVTFSSK